MQRLFVSAGAMENFRYAKAIGIGLINSAMNLTRELSSLDALPTEVIFVGSCGSFGAHKIGDIIESSCACNVENSFFSKAYTPISNLICSNAQAQFITKTFDPKNKQIGIDVSRRTINSSNYITRDESLWQNYLDRNIVAENMEFFSVASVARTFGVMTRGIFVVTNFCNLNAHEDFAKNHSACMEILNNYMHEQVL